MKQRPAGRPSSSEQIIRDIKRKTRKQYSAEEKIRIVLDGLRGEDRSGNLVRHLSFFEELVSHSDGLPAAILASLFLRCTRNHTFFVVILDQSCAQLGDRIS